MLWICSECPGNPSCVISKEVRPTGCPYDDLAPDIFTRLDVDDEILIQELRSRGYLVFPAKTFDKLKVDLDFHLTFLNDIGV